MKIERQRYIVMRNNRTEIWGGCARNFSFRKIKDLKDMGIKTYRSQKQAEASCSSWNTNYEIVPVRQIIKIEE